MSRAGPQQVCSMQTYHTPLFTYAKPRKAPQAMSSSTLRVPSQIDNPQLASRLQVLPCDTLKVAVYSAQEYVKDFLSEPLMASFPRAFFIEAPLSESTAGLASDCDAVCLFVNDACDSKVIDRLAQMGVRLVAMRCAGYDRVDLAAANHAGIQVVRVPSYSPRSVAEHAVTLTLCLNRSVHLAYNRVREGNYTLSGLTGHEIHTKTIGIVGTGGIGSAAACIFQGLGCKVLAHDPYPCAALVARGVEYVPLEQLLAESFVVSLHCPLLPSTWHLIDADRLALMRPDALLINCGRGGLVDTDALVEALASGRLGGVGMDVYEREGGLFFTDTTRHVSSDRWKYWDRQFQTLLAFPNVLVTPHSAFLTYEALSNIAATTVANLTAFALGQPLPNLVAPPPAGLQTGLSA